MVTAPRAGWRPPSRWRSRACPAEAEPSGRGDGDLRRERLAGRQAEPHAVADLGDRDDLGLEAVLRRARRALVARQARSRSPRGRRSRPRGPRPRRCSPPRRRRRARPASARPGPAAALPVSTTAPVKSATKADPRRGGQLAGAALLHHPAGVDHPHAVAELGGLGEVVGDQQRRHARRRASTAASSRAARGARARVERGQRLVEQQHVGAGAPAPARARRAGARRPTASRGRASASRSIPRRSSRSSARGAALAARQLPQRVGHVAPGAQVREEGVLLEQVAAAAQVGRQVAPARRCRARSRSPQRTRPRSGRSSPATTRRMLVLPAPDGPRERQALAGRDVERHVQLERAQAGARLNAEHARAPPSRPRASPTAGSRPPAATRTADSASAASKSVAKRS